MSNLILDGYNLIGIQHDNVEAERLRLVEALIEYRARSGHDITVVFDGWRGGGARASHQRQGGITVVYSPLGQKADELIIKMLGPHPEQVIVVSSDREVQDRAWGAGSVPVDSERFLHALNRYEPCDGEYMDEDDEDGQYQSHNRKGSAWKPSRRQKAIERALKKL